MRTDERSVEDLYVELWGPANAWFNNRQLLALQKLFSIARAAEVRQKRLAEHPPTRERELAEPEGHPV